MPGISYLIKYRKHKNSKLLYYQISGIRYCTPRFFPRMRRNLILNRFYKLDQRSQDYITTRVNYYNKLGKLDKAPIGKKSDGTEMVFLKDLKLGAVLDGKRSRSAHVFDAYEYIRFFNKKYMAGFLFGDITYIPQTPSFVKSRPIEGDNANSIILPLGKNRHFTFVRDNRKFEDKKNMLVGRAFVDQPHRIRFWEMYFNHPMCNLGNINHNLGIHPEWNVEHMPIDEHLDYKFILCLEGNDVATNLKWVMSSNSLAVMPEPRYETWFMEGHLIPDFHYVKIKADFSDLADRMKYYIEHPEAAQEITQNANEYVSQFRNRRRERLIGLMVVDKYFINTGQKRSLKKSADNQIYTR